MKPVNREKWMRVHQPEAHRRRFQKLLEKQEPPPEPEPEEVEAPEEEE